MIVHVQLGGEKRRIPRSELEALAREGRIGPETPVEWDGAWRTARELPEWESWVRNAATLVRQAWDTPRVPWATALIVGLNIRVALWLPLAPNPMQAFEAGSRDSAAIVERGEVWRIVSYAFLHSGFAHISQNMLFVAYLGLGLERLLSGRAFLSLYIFGISAAALASTFLSPDVPSVGASGGDFALIGAAIVLGVRWADVIPARVRGRFGLAMVVYAALVLIPQIGAKGIDHWCHWAGLAAGLGYGAFLEPGNTRRNARTATVGLGIIAVAAATIVASSPRLEPMVPLEDDGTTTVRPAWWTTGWVPTGEMGYSSPLHDAHIALHTETRTSPTTPADMLETWQDELVALDPAATVEVAGDRATARYQGKEGPREAAARAIVKGVYARTLIVDVPAGDRRGPWLARSLDTLEVGPPAEVTEALGGADSHAWRLKAKAAKAAADFGDLDRGKQMMAEVRAEWPDDPQVALAELRIYRQWRDPALEAKAEAALAAFPGSRAIIAEVAGCWADLGQPERALALLQTSLLVAPGDRTLDRAVKELTP